MRRALLNLISVMLLVCAVPAFAADAPSVCPPSAIITGCGTQTTSGFAGAIIVPGSDEANAAVARSRGCEGCEWTLVLNCDRNDLDDPEWVNCNAAHCRDGTLFRLYLQQPGDARPQYVDTICLSPTQRIVTAADLSVDAERYLRDLAPPPTAIEVQPHGPAVTGLAAFFVADGPATSQATLDVTTGAGPARLTIDISADEFAWDFGDGAQCVTASPGGGYDGGGATAERCDDLVAHLYRDTGDVTVRLRATWHGTYTFDVGFGPVGPRPVPGTGVTGPEARRALTIRQGRAELVGR
jgi:hypothetical protein